jgi:hypothetical protein
MIGSRKCQWNGIKAIFREIQHNGYHQRNALKEQRMVEVALRSFCERQFFQGGISMITFTVVPLGKILHFNLPNFLTSYALRPGQAEGKRSQRPTQ